MLGVHTETEKLYLPLSNVVQVMKTDTKVIIIKINICNKDSDSIYDI